MVFSVRSSSVENISSQMGVYRVSRSSVRLIEKGWGKTAQAVCSIHCQLYEFCWANTGQICVSFVQCSLHCYIDFTSSFDANNRQTNAATYVSLHYLYINDLTKNLISNIKAICSLSSSNQLATKASENGVVSQDWTLGGAHWSNHNFHGLASLWC